MSALTEKMKTMVGYCTNCGVEVMDRSAARGKKKLPNYREHTLEMSDGSLLTVAVCDACKPLLVAGGKVDETANRILKHHKIYWQENRRDDHGDGRPDRFDKLTVSDPNSNILKNRSKKLGYRPDLSEENKKKQIQNEKDQAKAAKEEAKRLKDLEKYNADQAKEKAKLEKEHERQMAVTEKLLKENR